MRRNKTTSREHPFSGRSGASTDLSVSVADAVRAERSTQLSSRLDAPVRAVVAVQPMPGGLRCNEPLQPE